MKKLASLLLAVVILGSCLSLLSACNTNDDKSKVPETNNQTGNLPNKDDESFDNSNDDNKANEDISNNGDASTEETREKITSKIEGGTLFSAGLALVNYYGHDSTYCIDEEGYIVFKLNEKIYLNAYGADESFKSGFRLVGESLYDKTEKKTNPTDVGATKFYSFALNNGHIFASVIESTFENSSKKLGIMNLEFEWILEPSEEIYNAFALKNGGFTFQYFETVYYHNGNYYSKIENDSSKYNCIDMKSGAIYQIASDEIKFKDTIDYYELKIDYPTAVELTEFVNGKAGVLFCNSETDIYYASMVDEDGELLFDPVDVGYCYYNLATDGNIIILTSYFGWDIISIDKNGKTLGNITDLNDTVFDNDGRLGVYLCNGILWIGNSYSKEVRYFNSKLEPLFE